MEVVRKLVTETLQDLFNGYIKSGGTQVFPINKVAQKYNVEPHELGRLLLSEDMIKNQRFEHDGFSCSISYKGIDYVSPDYFNDLIANISITAGLANDWVSLMDNLSFGPKDFQIAFDVAKVIESRGIAEAQYQHNDVHVKLTSFGMQEYQRKNSGGFH